jgi:hypothetical protein
MSAELRRRLSTRGNVHPRSWPAGRSHLRAECLIEGIEPRIDVTARFAQTVERQVLDAAGNPVEELIAAGRRYRGGEEPAEHEVTLTALPNRAAEIRTAGKRRAELTEHGAPAGAIAWNWEPLHATLEAWIDELEPGLRRVRVEIANRLEWAGEPVRRARMRTLHSARLLLHSPDGAFASLANPPAHLREHSAACRNEGLWPVPLGEAGDRRTVLAAPVRLEDYPAIDADAWVGAAA